MKLFNFFRRKPRSILEALQSSPDLRQQKELFDAMAAMCDAGIDADEFPDGVGEYGLTATNPIPCRTVFGSTAYLGRLRAADSAKVAYHRVGSTQSPVSSQPVDIYQVKHPTGLDLVTLYISPYQKRISKKAPLGFMLAGNSFEDAAPIKDIVTAVDGTVRYYSCGVLHREDGPAVIETYADHDGPDRHRSWYRFGVLDREHGPAITSGLTVSGVFEWWRAGLRHREGGPAVIELIDSFSFGCGPVYEWWRNGVQYKVQDGYGVIYFYKDGEPILTELPDGSRIISREGVYRYEDADGNDLGNPPPLEAFNSYLEDGECLNDLYEEPQSTFDDLDEI